MVLFALEDLQIAWRPYYKTQISCQRTEINPLFCAIVPQNETCMVVTFDVEMGGDTPTNFTICMPYSIIQPLVLLFKVKGILKSPVVKVVTSVLDLGYKSTPLPAIVNSATSRIKQSFSNPSPASPPIPDPKADDSDGSLELLKTIEARMAAGLLKNEHPQTLALILANVKKPGQTARILKELPPEVQADVFCRMATLEPIPSGVINEIESVLSHALKAYEAASAGMLGGIESVAEILASMDTLTETRILATIEESNPELAEQIRELMFTLEDLVLIITKGMQAVLKENPKKRTGADTQDSF